MGLILGRRGPALWRFDVRAETQSVTLEAAAERVFSFLADPANLPRWAIHFARTVRPNSDGSWTVRGAEGEVAVRLETNRALGVVDWILSPAPGVEALAASRVLPNGPGSELVFTQFQAPGMSDAAFERLVHDLSEELAELRRVIDPA
jgi:uncharacterized protein YndB with AHSA1/START domain